MSDSEPAQIRRARQARQLLNTKRQAEQRDRLISYLAARGITQIEQHLKEATR
jgi:beta-lactamase superfamily II metal-dependent hydrolase